VSRPENVAARTFPGHGEGALPGLHAISSKSRAGHAACLRSDAKAKRCWERSIDNEDGGESPLA
jgi:hypothetical protein